MVDQGVSDIGERQPPERGDGIVGADAAGGHVVEQCPQRRFVHARHAAISIGRSDPPRSNRARERRGVPRSTDGQRDDEPGPARWSVTDGDGAAVAGHDVGDDGEAESGVPRRRSRDSSSRANRSKMSPRRSDGTPGPSSSTVNVAVASCSASPTVTRAAACRRALSNRLRTTRRSASASPPDLRGRTRRRRRRRRSPPAAGARLLEHDVVEVDRHRGGDSIAPASLRARASRSSISRCSPAISSSWLRRVAAASARSGLRSSTSSSVRIRVSGVRSSWDASATKRCWRSAASRGGRACRSSSGEAGDLVAGVGYGHPPVELGHRRSPRPAPDRARPAAACARPRTQTTTSESTTTAGTVDRQRVAQLGDALVDVVESNRRRGRHRRRRPSASYALDARRDTARRRYASLVRVAGRPDERRTVVGVARDARPTRPPRRRRRARRRADRRRRPAGQRAVARPTSAIRSAVDAAGSRRADR